MISIPLALVFVSQVLNVPDLAKDWKKMHVSFDEHCLFKPLDPKDRIAFRPPVTNDPNILVIPPPATPPNSSTSPDTGAEELEKRLPRE